uniref:Uncharacterized protein n=1 Tax=Buteo japonicus TaxID=224669 RepID=A0A8C0BK89_9AVES
MYHLLLFLLLFSSGASSYFLPLKETLHLQNETKLPLIDEMLCLLEAEKDPINNQSCARYNTKKFIHELGKIPMCNCLKTVKAGMEKLEENCPILKKPSRGACSEDAITNFSLFKKRLEEFLKWVNQKQNCNNITTSESDLYSHCNCSCPALWKYGKGLF